MKRRSDAYADVRISAILAACFAVVLLQETSMYKEQPSLAFSNLLNFTSVSDHAHMVAMGWIGFILMIAMNIYTLRKRVNLFPHIRLTRLLNFHIFCGLVGPLFILAHAGWPIHGLAAASLVCMLISVASGILGHYLFRELANRRASLHEQMRSALRAIKDGFDNEPSDRDSEEVTRLKQDALRLAGVIEPSIRVSPWRAVFYSLGGDIQLLLWNFAGGWGLPQELRKAVRQYAVCQRRRRYLSVIESAVSHWHAFHLPFALFMYLTAVVHIVTELAFSALS